MRRKGGLTLIELLVIVAIIGVVASLVGSGQLLRLVDLALGLW